MPKNTYPRQVIKQEKFELGCCIGEIDELGHRQGRWEFYINNVCDYSHFFVDNKRVGISYKYYEKTKKINWACSWHDDFGGFHGMCKKFSETGTEEVRTIALWNILEGEVLMFY